MKTSGSDETPRVARRRSRTRTVLHHARRGDGAMTATVECEFHLIIILVGDDLVGSTIGNVWGAK